MELVGFIKGSPTFIESDEDLIKAQLPRSAAFDTLHVVVIGSSDSVGVWGDYRGYMHLSEGISRFEQSQQRKEIGKPWRWSAFLEESISHVPLLCLLSVLS